MVGPKAIIHLGRLKANYDLVKQKVHGKQIMAVVKANGYGHGGIACAKALENHGCRFFAVFSFDEGVELRNAGIKSDILLLSRLDARRIDEAIDHGLILNISNKLDFTPLITYAKKIGTCPKVHLKVDTGMTRLGIDFDDAANLITKVKGPS